ncbi:MAG: cell division topological specificity factor MinE [Myxococcales bacterium]|nr:cell division topological specificity factor MinE [Myxococcales bacterium]HRC59058.1 cell division topological specificity factor MinE [Kofleriaceae bacterium]
MWNGIKSLITGGRSSREVAKGRLHLVLAHDRSGLEGGKLQEMRQEIAAVIARYVDIDANAVEISIESHSRETQLMVSSPLPARHA